MAILKQLWNLSPVYALNILGLGHPGHAFDNS